jgi:hypothetical protein
LHTSKKSIIGRALARIFCGLLIGSNVGVNTKWISTIKNVIANKILRFKTANHEPSSLLTYNYANLQQEQEELKTCSCLPAESQASLAPLGNYVDKKMSRLKPHSELETTRFRQAVYIKFTKQNHMPNPCGSKPGYKRIVACFNKRFMMDHNSWYATVCGYAESVNTLFQLQNLPAHANLSDQTNMCARIILAREKEEDIAKQQSPITREMFAALCNLANKTSANLLEAVVADWFKFIRITGLRCAEYAQKTQSAFNKHEYPSGKRIVKAFIPTD